MAENRIGKNLEALRTQRGMTQEALAELAGTSIASISYWENGWKTPRASSLAKLCKALGCTEAELVGYSDGFYNKASGISAIKARPSKTYAPVIGNVAAGDPKEAIELSDETRWVPPQYLDKHPDGFFLKVQGDSMDKILPDGCFAFIAPCDPSSGDICAVKVNGEDATVKRVKIIEDAVILEPASHNPSHKRRIIDSQDPDAPFFKILGRVVWFDSEL